MLKTKNIILASAFTLMLASCDQQESNHIEQPPATIEKTLLSPQAISLNNQGVGEMGSFDYDKATTTFEKLVASSKDWNIAQQNLAIALLNRQKDGDEARAMKIAEDLSATDDKNLVAHYIVGILKFNQGLCDGALPRFEKVSIADKSDAYALYFAGQCRLQNGEIETALKLYQQAIKADSYLRSAYYGSFMAAQRLAKNDTAKQMLDAYQKLANNPKARLAEIKYTRMGPKANALAINKIQSNTLKKQTKPPYFAAPKPLGHENIDAFGIVSLNEENLIYTVIDNNLHFFNKENKQVHPNLSIELLDGNHKLAWGDINNDNKIDVYVTGKHDQLYLQEDLGFKAFDMQSSGLKNLASMAVRLADTDHDGDLDILLLNQQGQFELWNNNLNNTFTPLSSTVKLTKEMGYNTIYLSDIDSDRDIDIILTAKNKLTTLLNNRMWDYEIITTPYPEEILSLSLADNNNDGIVELSLLFDKKISSYVFDNKAKQYAKNKDLKIDSSQTMIQLDINGNARDEYLLRSSEGIKLIDDNGKTLEQILLNDVSEIKVANSLLGPELLVRQKQGLTKVPANKNRLAFMLLEFTGKEDDANSVRSNYSGIGTHFIVHNQDFYAIGNSHHNLTGVDQDFQGVAIASGNKSPIDFLGINWSDGVYQTELAIDHTKQHKITETQRQLSSCPVIFAWNKGQYEFISDVLGVGGIGFAIGRNEYGTPRPWENYLLTAEQISANNGLFKLQFTEPMEESAYLDEFKIKVIDVPQEYQVTLDERMQISEPKVTGKTVFYQEMIQPIKATNQANHDVTEDILTTNKKAAKIENQDHRFLGLVDEQVITLDFEQDLLGEYQFIMNGWVEYGYSQTMFAAWQADLVAQAPSLEYYANGEWKELLTEFGYPAGMPRQASVPIELPEATKSLRIRTNMEIYFDQLGLIKPQKPVNIKTYQLKLQSSVLKQLGFPKRENNSQRVPQYDFNKISPFWDTRYMQGAYSRLGDITPLVKNQDNALAIIGAGEAIEFSFVDDLPELERGFKRYFILQFKGWAKDMDILTKQGETLAPIPANGKINAQTKKLNQKFNTRFKAGK